MTSRRTWVPPGLIPPSELGSHAASGPLTTTLTREKRGLGDPGAGGAGYVGKIFRIPIIFSLSANRKNVAGAVRRSGRMNFSLSK